MKNIFTVGLAILSCQVFAVAQITRELAAISNNACFECPEDSASRADFSDYLARGYDGLYWRRSAPLY